VVPGLNLAGTVLRVRGIMGSGDDAPRLRESTMMWERLAPASWPAAAGKYRGFSEGTHATIGRLISAIDRALVVSVRLASDTAPSQSDRYRG
jgi:hypothetical protein